MAISRIPLGTRVNGGDEGTKTLTCWQFLIIIITATTVMFAFSVMLSNASYYRNIDEVVEECTIDWDSYFPCHVMHIWWQMNQQNSIYDLRCFLTVLLGFNIAVSVHYIAASILLVFGFGLQSPWYLIPWLVLKPFIIVFLLGLVFVETFVIGNTSSRYFVMTYSLATEFIFNWIIGLVAYCQLRKVYLKNLAINNLNYLRFDN